MAKFRPHNYRAPLRLFMRKNITEISYNNGFVYRSPRGRYDYSRYLKQPKIRYKFASIPYILNEELILNLKENLEKEENGRETIDNN